MTPQEIDRIQNAINHIKSAVDIDPWAVEIAVEAMEKELKSSSDGQPNWETCFDCPLSHGCPKIKGCTNEQAIEYASQIPTDCPLSAQPEWGKPVGIDRPLADSEVVSRLRDIQKQIGGSYAIERVIEVLEQLSSPQPEIVRCHECIHWNRDTVRQNSNDAGWWNEAICERHSDEIWTSWKDADWFCADAERRTDG